LQAYLAWIGERRIKTSLKLHSNHYPNHLQTPRIHKIAETKLIPLSTRGRGEVEKQMW
jgi:hypothetical protein